MPTGNAAICSKCRKATMTSETDPIFVDGEGRRRQLPRDWTVVELTSVHGCRAGELCDECSPEYEKLVEEFVGEGGLTAENRRLPEEAGMPPLARERPKLGRTPRLEPSLLGKKSEPES